MSTYLYELPTTGAISFADFCSDQSNNKSYVSFISESTQVRANLRAALKESKRTDDNEKDYLRVVKVLDEYLPLLRGIMASVAHDEIGLKSEPVFSWRATLSASLFHASSRHSLPSLHAEYAYVLLTYAFALSNLARSSVKALGTYEHDRAISDSERRAKDEKLNFAVNLLLKASGIFQYVSETALLEWDNSRDGGTAGLNKPPDLSREVNSALAKMSLADAQSLAIRKLLSKSAYDSNIAPGPPLPESHPSPVLLAKIHLECASLYSSALSLAKTSAPSKGKDTGDGDVRTDLRRYLSDETSFHNALARKWLGIDAGENGKGDKGGEAVGFLAWAKKDLEELKDGGKGLGIGKEKEKKERRKEKVTDELQTVTVFWKHYKKVNDSLTFQPIPPQPDLQARIPTGRLALPAKPFNPPLPIFGPGSVEYARQKAEELELPDDSPASTLTSPPETAGKSYAGAGSYF
ncbi:hypothetical protein EYR40_006318 [Pleurotus pulmonarius]|nr:hypothetical protein EYR36_010939 [Pleurotus pulmonarius]KAF4597968.1 hypothetical protein EYR38_006360 [Pleurotus pulmonarius]KAF4599228.1 hypothetical protein EYR40_006318 [Pleurotus pulmonarius]